MFSHFTLGTDDLSRTSVFYDAVLATLGIKVCFSGDDMIAYGSPNGMKVILTLPFDGNPMHPGNGVHTAFLARTKEEVDRFYAEALRQGGTCEGAPGPRPQYHPYYYAAYVRDLEGNKLQAVFHGERWDEE